MENKEELKEHKETKAENSDDDELEELDIIEIIADPITTDETEFFTHFISTTKFVNQCIM